MPVAIRPAEAESIFDVGRRLNSLLEEAERQAVEGQLPESARSRLADVLDALRSKLGRETERDPRSVISLLRLPTTPVKGDAMLHVPHFTIPAGADRGHRGARRPAC